MNQRRSFISLEDIRNSAAGKRPENAHLFGQGGKKNVRRAKYNNEKVNYDRKVFASKREYNRYRELLVALKHGVIGMLRLQVPYELNEGGTHHYKYVADFVYTDVKTGIEIIEDCKGFRTREYEKKKRLMLKVHGIEIKET